MKEKFKIMTPRDIFLAIIVALAWGSNFIAVKFAIIELPAILALALRFVLTAILLLPFVKIPQVNFKKLIISAIIFGVLYLGMLYYGMRLGLNTSLAVIIMQLNVPMSLIIAQLIFHEHLTKKAIIGTAIAFMGMLVIAGTPHFSGNMLAAGIVLFSAFFNALFNIQNKQLKSVPPLSLLFWNSFISSLFLILISLITEGNPIEFIQGVKEMSTWIAIFYSALISGVLGISLWIYLLQKYPIYQVSPFNLLVPFFGVSLSVLILNEELSWYMIVGGIITIMGVGLTQVKRI